ncbi:MAG: hypothetical protein LBK28_07145 [Propionibacteriaceae bacterium]|jgi:hypothetical protein|nr:hypothetical protein [Propionibacteriaceae bacterium]
MVQPIPGGIIAIGSRCHLREDAPELNAEVYDTNGQLLRAGCFGDGIELARATQTGNVWVGYSDEGVYGNYGWGGTGRSRNTGKYVEPLGHAGAVLWSASTFEKLWEATEIVDDVYAATLLGEDLWATTYVDFPIRHLSTHSERAFPTSDSGPRAIITDGSRAATFGQYGDPFTFRVWTLQDDPERPPVSTGRLSVPGLGGQTKPRMMGFSDELNVFVGSSWFKLSLGDLTP